MECDNYVLIAGLTVGSCAIMPSARDSSSNQQQYGPESGARCGRDGRIDPFVDT